SDRFFWMSSIHWVRFMACSRSQLRCAQCSGKGKRPGRARAPKKMGGPHATPPQSTGENRIAPRRLPEAIAPLGRSPHWRTAWTDSSRGRARQQGVACNAAFQVIRYIYVETAANSDMDAIQTCPHNPLAEGLTAQRGQFSCGWAARKSPASIPPRRCNSIQDGAVGDVLLQAHVRRATHHHGACRRTVLHH